METDFKKIAELNIEKSIGEVFDPKQIRGFLRVIGQFPLFDYRNQLLIWKQVPDAKVVVGKMGYESDGHVVPEGAKKVLLLSPAFSLIREGLPKVNDSGEVLVDSISKAVVYEVLPEYSSDYECVVGYDVSEDADEIPRNTEGLLNKIKLCSGYSVNEIDEAELPEGSKYGEIDIENNTFRIREGLSENMFYAELICQYVEEERKDFEADDRELCLRALAKIAVCSAFGVSYREQSTVRANTARRQSQEYKRDLIKDLSAFVSETVMDLSVQYLTFNEVVIANALLHEPNFSDMQIDFFTVRENIEDDYLKEQILRFTDKLFYSKEGYLEGLCEKVKDRSLYTYPPYEFEYMDTTEKNN